MTTSVRTPQHDFPHDLVGTVIFGTEGRVGIAANVTSHSVIVDPSVCPKGVSLHRRLYSEANRLRTVQSRC